MTIVEIRDYLFEHPWMLKVMLVVCLLGLGTLGYAFLSSAEIEPDPENILFTGQTVIMEHEIPADTGAVVNVNPVAPIQVLMRSGEVCSIAIGDTLVLNDPVAPGDEE